MDPIRNPFAPGAGSPPPELAGRDSIVNDAEIAIKRVMLGKHGKSQILMGLRGTGKTVLLNKIREMADDEGAIVSGVEAPENRRLADLLYPKVFQVLRKLSFVESSKAAAYSALRALRSFASAFKVQAGELSLSVDAEEGVADSGKIDLDLIELFERVGQAAKSARKTWVLLIDEVQYLEEEELSALIMALHASTQNQLPILFFGAGLPQVAGKMGDAKSYSERLFEFPPIGALSETAAKTAISQPIINEGESIESSALDEIFQRTQGYPYFLQEWGYQAWNVADESPITKADIENASNRALSRLDDSFFRVRFDRLTPKEREYVYGMADLGDGPYRSADIADHLGEQVQSLGPRRASIISKGMIYSPAHGDIEFTVPMFADFLRRLRKK